jgi:hypothetical protein
MIIDGEWEKDVESSPLREEPDFDEIAMEEHFAEFHPGGGPCDCPVPTPEEIEAEWAERARQHREDEHGGGECHCEPPF